jgi:hypothetical protein
MANKVIQRTKPIQVGVNATARFDGSGIDGFIPYTSGTITITTALGLVIVNALPVTAGLPVPLPFILPDGSQTGTVTTAGGASGILCA